jgi:ribosomal protein S8
MSHRFTAPHRLCSHLQNVSRGAVARTSIPYTEASLAITSILLRHGLISSLALGSPNEARPSIFPSLAVADRRIWVALKYRNGLPVLRNMNVVSKGSFRVDVDHGELGRILTGKRARNVAGISMGEILVVRTPPDPKKRRTGRDIFMDGWEAWRTGLGGELLLRVS